MSARAQFLINGRIYKWSGWLGCQLESYEWFRVPAGTSRDLEIRVGYPAVTMTVFTTQREGLKIRTTWAVASIGTLDEHSNRVKELQDSLRKLI